jgi:Protein of unknown function (DUF3987)
VLSALSGVIGYTAVVRIKTGWLVSGNIYAAVVDAPGSRKSPAAGLAYRPLEKLQAMLRKAHKQELEAFERDMREHVVRKKRAAKEDQPEPDPPVRPKMRRCIVDDITVEALATRLEQNPRGFLSAHDELTGFIKGLDQYKSGGKGNARQAYLKMWSNNAIYMRWQEFMRLERRHLDKRREGKLRRALGAPLPGETKEQLDRIGERDRLRASHGLVAVLREDGRASYRYIDALGRDDMENRLAAKWAEEGWLKQRAECRREGLGAPPIPEHLS